MRVSKLILIYTLIKLSSSHQCFWNSHPYTQFSSKTVYNLIRGDIRDSVVNLKGCEVISIWTLIRHGKRSPGGQFAVNMKAALSIKHYVIDNYRRGDSPLCAQDVENLNNWQLDTELFNNGHALMSEGYQEMFGIGKRLREAYSKLLDDIENKNYIIRSASGQWVENGVDAFVDGLANNKTLKIERLVPHNDSLAVYFKCPKYVINIRRNPSTYMEYEKYLLTPEFLSLKKNVESRVGMKLTNDNITALYDLCRYVWSAIDNKPSPWCALFSTEDLEIMEYSGDLRHYYRNSYGNKINVQMGQIVIADLYRKFLGVINGHELKITAYFSHATMLDMILSALGLFKDKLPLTSYYRDVNRKWKSTKLSPIAGNLIATLHRCANEYKVAFYLNEELLISMCDNGICAWRDFENIFKPFLNTTQDVCF